MNSNLRLADLKREKSVASKLMNVKIPIEVSAGIEQAAKQLGVSKTNVVIALLNEGLDEAEVTLKDFKPAKVKLAPIAKDKMCSVKGCEKARVAKGYCTNHYQASRRASPSASKRKPA